MILGSGGAAKAVASYFLDGLRYSGNLSMVGRSESGKLFSNKLNLNWITWENLNSNLENQDLIINCTSIGYGAQKSLSPLNQTQIKMLKNASVIFDIVYQPINTVLLKEAKDIKISTLGGIEMNLEQAVLAFGYAINLKGDYSEIREAMSKV